MNPSQKKNQKTYKKVTGLKGFTKNLATVTPTSKASSNQCINVYYRVIFTQKQQMKGKLKLCCFFSHFVFHLVVSKPHFFEKLTASNGNSYDSFGYSVSIYDTYAVVGAVGSDVNISSGGVAYIFKYDNETNQWDEYSIVWPSDPSDNMQFGTSISLYQDFFIVGAWYQAPTYTGAAYVFQINKTTNANPKWVQVSKLTASDASVNDNFGKSVSITDEFAIVGSWHDNANGYQSGSAYIFEKQVNLTWVQVAKISPSDGSAYYSFGYSVAIGASNYNNGIYFVIVGAVYNDGGGCEEQENKAYIFELNTIATDESSNDWIETNIFYGNYDCFGVSVAIWDDVAVIGAYTSDTPRNSGSVTVVERANATNAWNVSTVLKTTSAIEGDYFGTSVGVYQNTIIVGATHVNTPSYDSGRAYIFYKDKDANQWYEGSTLKDDGAAGYDYLGRSVSIYEQFAMAGANGDDTSKGSVSVFDDFLDPTYSPTQLPTLPVPSPVPTIAPTKNHSLTPTMEPTFATLQPTTVPTESTPHTATLTPTLLLTPASTNVTLFTEQTRTTEIRSNTTSVINISTTESLDLSSSYIMTTVIGEESTTALFVFDDDSVGNHIDPS